MSNDISHLYNWTSATEGATAVCLILGALGACIKVIFNGTRDSRCQNIRCCWGLVGCMRDPLDKEELAVIQEEPIIDPENPEPVPNA